MGARACRREGAGREAVYCEPGFLFFFLICCCEAWVLDAKLGGLWCVVCVKQNMVEWLSERKKTKLGTVREKKDFDCESQY